MKKLLFLGVITLMVACNSSETEQTIDTSDSAVNSNPAKNINDVPMRTHDTTTNLMKDSLGYIPDNTDTTRR